MSTIFHAAAELQDFCDQQGWRSCLIGGIAVQHWSQARITRDIDITLLTGFGAEASFVDRLLSRYAPRTSDAAQFALRSRILLLSSPEGIGIDVSLGALPFEYQAVEQSSAPRSTSLNRASPSVSVRPKISWS
jgi:hypothetical protein